VTVLCARGGCASLAAGAETAMFTSRAGFTRNLCNFNPRAKRLFTRGARREESPDPQGDPTRTAFILRVSKGSILEKRGKFILQPSKGQTNCTMVHSDDVLERVLSKLEAIDSRLNHIEGTIDHNSRTIDNMNAGVVKRMVHFGTTDVGEACGVISVGHNELIGEAGPRSGDSAEKKRQRRARQDLGAKLYTVYCTCFFGLMAVSFLDLLPVFQWERMKFDLAEEVSTWLGDNMHLPFLFSFAYVVVVFGIQFAMESRKEFDLKLPLAVWSLLLAAFSLAGSLRTVPVLLKLIYTKGVYHVVCGDTRNDWVIDNPAGVWTMFFIFSKVPELIDTLFIVLRKRKLITLHWYHHITVMTFCWHSWATFCLNGLVYSAMNLTVHAFM